jgi:hypothetical protein
MIHKPTSPSVAHGHRTSVALDPMLARTFDDNTRYTCLDGVLTSSDVAKAAGVSRKAAKRAIDAFCAAHDEGRLESNGATVTLPGKAPDPATQTRAEMARIVAERLCIGRFALKQRIAERAATRPPAKPKEKRVTNHRHPWLAGKHGREAHSQQGGTVVATLTCSKCTATDSITFRQLCDANEMDRKFGQRGWSVDPAKCPDHNRRNHSCKETKTMATEAPTFAAPSPAAIAAQAKMFGLLQMHFDPETGTYGSGYSDAKVAADCRLSVDMVAAVRKEAFGDLKVPSEAQLNADIAALESLLEEATAPIRSELASLKRRVADCCKKFGG